MDKQTNRGFFKTLAAQFAKFGVVGFLAFLIDYGVLMVLTQALGWDPVLSAAISFVISVVFNYLASMRYVFTRRDDLSRRKEFVLFVVLSVIGLGINELVIWAGTAAFGVRCGTSGAGKNGSMPAAISMHLLSGPRRTDPGTTDR